MKASLSLRYGPFVLATAVLAFLPLHAQQPAATPTPTPTPPPLEASTTPILNDDWGHGHERYVADAKARADQIQIVLLGDSITIRWTTGAGRDLYKERYEPLGAINLGISADGTQHVLWRIQNGELAPLHPKMVLLMIGTNDMGLEPDAVAYGVWSVVNEIRKTHPDTRVLVEGIFPREDNLPKVGGTLWPKIAIVNQLLAKLDDGKMVKYIYFGDKFLTPDGGLNREWFTDGTHPERPEAFKIWADAVQPVVDEWIKLPPVPNVPPPPSPVAVPADLTAATPVPRNDWLFRFKRQVAVAAKGNCDLLFLGGTTMSLWDRRQDLFLKEYRAYKALNFANNGSRTENIIWGLDNGGLTGLTPKVIVVQGQDLNDNTPAENVAAGMGVITERLKKLYPQAKILLLGDFPMGAKPTDGIRTKIDSYNAALAKLADDKTVYFLDVGKAFIKADGSLEQIPAPAPFVPETFDKWADAQRDTIGSLMKSTP
jgi:lysophospholipase L1-like esterase